MQSVLFKFRQRIASMVNSCADNLYQYPLVIRTKHLAPSITFQHIVLRLSVFFIINIVECHIYRSNTVLSVFWEAVPKIKGINKPTNLKR